MTNTTTTTTDKKQKLLIIEDEGEMCLLINMLLDGKGLEVEHVKTISETVEYFQQHQPAIVLLDNRLPDGFGVDLISFIRKKYPATKIIMISGVDTTIKDLALENGADAFLEKPFTKAEIWQVINSFLN
ncbi:response regulator [Chitinophaga sp. XS-30]|uniref:response regulator n=1 Tax=Chitinophaga sp. XS-30 TaxID=2604421 RepID=UPI00143DDFBD|nr:response regulator [Chitinophaga sp. XS-30]